MKCKDCEYFRVMYEPLRDDNGYMDLGRAECKKHNLIVDFLTHRKLNRLDCIEEVKE